MITEKLNELFASKEMNNILINIARQNDLRMCLNLNAMNEYKNFFGKIIVLSFVVDILPIDLIEIYKDTEKYISQKLCLKLGIKEINGNKRKIEKFLNEILGGRQILFHGTMSPIAQKALVDTNQNYIVLQPCKIIDSIYRKHNIYKAFESGIQDFEDKNFWVTTNPSSASFYSLQSPEYFARFASRSDYYKQDIFKYDRLAYYRKDFQFCKKNIKKEMKEFHFNHREKKTVQKNFTEMWGKIVIKDLQNLILFKKIKGNNVQHFEKNDKIFDLILKYFKKVHFKYAVKNFKKNFEKIILPDVKKYLKRHYPIINRKFVVINDKKLIPDFYSTNEYFDIKYFTFKDNKPSLLKKVNKKIKNNDFLTLIELVNETIPNTRKAKNFLNQKSLPNVADIILYYKNEFLKKVKELENEKSMSAKVKLIKDICGDVGLKYILSLKYKKFIKDISLYNIYQYRKYLGIKLFEHYDGVTTITLNKIEALIDLYKKILKDEAFVCENNIPLKIYNKEIELIK